MNYLLPVALLGISSCFMVTAWYGQLLFTKSPLWKVILISWLIAFFEYLFMIPANRIGHKFMSAAQLRVIAEFFSVVAFIFFSTIILKEKLTLNLMISFIFILIAVYFAFYGPFKN